MTAYYYIVDKGLIGRTDGPGFLNSYIYKAGTGLIPDSNIKRGLVHCD